MKRCDFCSIADIIMKYIKGSENISQPDLMFLLFDDFLRSDVSADFAFDNGLICRWLKGTSRVSPQISRYYSENQHKKAMSIDIENNILPIMYDTDMAINDLYRLIIYDTAVSEQKRKELCEKYPYKTDKKKSDFIATLLCFSMERSFVKRNSEKQALLSAGELSPAVSDYIYDSAVPKPCRHFCGRDTELETLHSMLEDNSKIFIQGVAGIGKSEFVKMYACKYKKEYTNILYFNYNNSLKQIIIDCDFVDDNTEDNESTKFKRHNRFLKSLKEDTLIIIDNFNTVASNEELLDVIMNYRCKILFTTRSRFDDYIYYDLREISDIYTLVSLVNYFYKDTEKNFDIIKQIIEEVHRHTLSVELSARLLSSGISRPKKLLRKLKKTKSVLHTEDKINIIKDGTSSKATYYEHIHTLISMFSLSKKAINIMRDMTLIPYDGIDSKLFGQLTGLNTLNTVNDLIEYGFIQLNDYGKIVLHPLIQEIAVDDTKPSIKKCGSLIENIRRICLFHGIDLPYHKLLFKIIKNVIYIAENDNTEQYKLFLKDVFAYMEKYSYCDGLNMVISELEKLSTDKADKVLLFDYKAAYEHIYNNNPQKALMYEIQAADLCNDIEAENPHLISNIYGNLGALYNADRQIETAKLYMEKAYHILLEAGLEYTNDSVIQLCNYANLIASMGEYQNAVNVLKKCAEAVKEYNSLYSSDYANIIWNIGCIYTQTGNIESAEIYFNKVLNIYSVVWEDEPELIQIKINEIKEITQMYDINKKDLIGMY